jgi:hypothetical protein
MKFYFASRLSVAGGGVYASVGKRKSVNPLASFVIMVQAGKRGRKCIKPGKRRILESSVI